MNPSSTHRERLTHARIAGVGSYLPERVMTNAELEALVDTSDEWIATRTGIRSRHIADPAQATSDLAAQAGARALERAGVAPEAVDLLIVATSTADYPFPSTACITQAKLGMTCPAFDVMAVCTGFVYALQVGASQIESGRARTVLVIGADCMSRIVDWQDRSTCVLFGDGAGAVVLTASESAGVLGVHLGADGTGRDMLWVPSGGSASPATDETIAARDVYLKMAGSEVFKFAVRAIPRVTKQALKESGLGVADIDWLVPHQANQRILDTVGERLGIDHDHVVSTVARHGNTSAASIPLALDDLYTCGHLQPGDVLALVGFGAGLTWGAAIVRWTEEVS